MNFPELTAQERNMPALFDTNVMLEKFPGKFRTNVSLARYTSARIGGSADGMLTAESITDLVEMVTFLWFERIPFQILGGGSNVLVSDAGVRGIIVLNKARQVDFNVDADPPTVWAASGSNLGRVSRQAATLGLAGLEWGSGIPGSIGGAVVGNAGAYDGDIAGQLILAEILHQVPVDESSDNGNSPEMVIEREEWSAERFEFDYRSSIVKRNKYGTGQLSGKHFPGWVNINQPEIVILAALLQLERSTKSAVTRRLEELADIRHRTQPPGASMGSMFKNPPGDFAGRLIEEAGLKGIRIGDAAISPLHGNFFINYGNASARDVLELINLAYRVVENKFGIFLELEIELIGSWQDELDQ